MHHRLLIHLLSNVYVALLVFAFHDHELTVMEKDIDILGGIVMCHDAYINATITISAL